jgi:hypothetical protein
LESVLEQALRLPASVQEQLLQQLLVNCPQATAATTPRGKRVPLPFTPKDCARELKWLDAHRHEYAGQWVAVEGDQLIAHDEKAKAVFAACDAAGVADPYFTSFISKAPTPCHLPVGNGGRHDDSPTRLPSID